MCLDLPSTRTTARHRFSFALQDTPAASSPVTKMNEWRRTALDSMQDSVSPRYWEEYEGCLLGAWSLLWADPPLVGSALAWRRHEEKA